MPKWRTFKNKMKQNEIGAMFMGFMLGIMIVLLFVAGAETHKARIVDEKSNIITTNCVK